MFDSTLYQPYQYDYYNCQLIARPTSTGGYELDIVKTYKKEDQKSEGSLILYYHGLLTDYLQQILNSRWSFSCSIKLYQLFLRLVILLPTEARASEIPSSKRPPTIEKMPRTDSTLNSMSVSILDILSSSFCSRIYPCQSIL